jgi:anhydro-N-acetylmuramic acid kinase
MKPAARAPVQAVDVTDIYVGLISGTSMDGIDAVVVDFSPSRSVLIAAETFAFDSKLRGELDQVRANPDRFPVARLARLDAEFGDALATAADAIIRASGLTRADITAIGSHGQTILHRAEANPPHTLQIGDAHRIAARTGIITVADFRRADLAAGGQGAPLAPLVHRALLASPDEFRVVVNLGGIANITLLEPGRPVSGFDTGTANCYLDLWYRRHHVARFDHQGAWASGGHVDERWLSLLLSDPYLAQSPPKSTGIEYFSQQWLDQRLPDWAGQRPRDIQATLAEFSARSLVEAIQKWSTHDPDRLIVCGGGIHNKDLIERVRSCLGACTVQSSADFGLPPDAVEATLFAWLARERMNHQRQSTGSITGARHPVFLGTIHDPGPAVK